LYAFSVDDLVFIYPVHPKFLSVTPNDTKEERNKGVKDKKGRKKEK
jgi:hypothetical protein